MEYDGYEVGLVIKSLRIQKKLSREDMAAEIGISASAIKQ